MAVAIYPAILTALGVVSGLFSEQLGTALHLGMRARKTDCCNMDCIRSNVHFILCYIII